MWYPVKLVKEAGGVHETLKLPGSCGSCSAVRPVGLSAAVYKGNNTRDNHNPSCGVSQQLDLHHLNFYIINNLINLVLLIQRMLEAGRITLWL